MFRISADFNCMDVDECVWSNTVGANRDIEKNAGQLKEGLEVVLYMDDEFEVRGTLVLGGVTWKGRPDWQTIRYFDEKDRK